MRTTAQNLLRETTTNPNGWGHLRNVPALRYTDQCVVINAKAVEAFGLCINQRFMLSHINNSKERILFTTVNVDGFVATRFRANSTEIRINSRHVKAALQTDFQIRKGNRLFNLIPHKDGFELVLNYPVAADMLMAANVPVVRQKDKLQAEKKKIRYTVCSRCRRQLAKENLS